MDDSGGYDANFVVPPPNELICPVCTCVVRDPIQIVGCGHRLCSACYDSLKKFNKNCTCPTDRTAIKEDQVFPDVGAGRRVLSLEVKCDYFTKGCVWVGELRDLQKHIVDCFYQKIDDLVNLHDKFEKLESLLIEKDLEISELKRQIEILTKQLQAVSKLVENKQKEDFTKLKKDVISNTSKLQSLTARVDNKIKKLDERDGKSDDIDLLKYQVENIQILIPTLSATENKKWKGMEAELSTLRKNLHSNTTKLQTLRDSFNIVNRKSIQDLDRKINNNSEEIKTIKEKQKSDVIELADLKSSLNSVQPVAVSNANKVEALRIQFDENMKNADEEKEVKNIKEETTAEETASTSSEVVVVRNRNNVTPALVKADKNACKPDCPCCFAKKMRILERKIQEIEDRRFPFYGYGFPCIHQIWRAFRKFVDCLGWIFSLVLDCVLLYFIFDFCRMAMGPLGLTPTTPPQEPPKKIPEDRLY